MQRLENDGLDELGWAAAMLAALGFLLFALVYVLNWMGVLS